MRKLRSVILLTAIGCAVAVVGCAASPRAPSTTDAIIAEAQQRKAETITLVQRETLPSGWRVSCNEDQITLNRRCFAGKFGSRTGLPPHNIPFHIDFVDRPDGGGGRRVVQQLEVKPGYNTYPGWTPIVRVDDHETPFSSMQARELIKQLRDGQVARARYYVWPRGGEDMVADLTGFEEAFQMLLDLAPPAIVSTWR